MYEARKAVTISSLSNSSLERHLDGFGGGLPRTHGVNTMLVVADRLTKYFHFLPLKYPSPAKVLADLFAKEVVRLHGYPSSIVQQGTDCL